MDKNGELKENHSPCCICGETAVTLGTGRRPFCARHAQVATPTPIPDSIDKAAALMSGEEK